MRTASYQRQEKPSGGNAKIVEGENDTAMTITIGASRKTSTRTSTVQHKPMPKRAISAPRRSGARASQDAVTTTAIAMTSMITAMLAPSWKSRMLR